MKWFISTLLVLAALIGCDSNGNQDATAPDAPGRINLTESKRIVVEAENVIPDSISIPMVIQDCPGTSGGKCLVVPPGAGKPGTEKGPGAGKEIFGQVSYDLNIPADGKYIFWGRAFWMHGCGNSFNIATDDSRPRVFNGTIFNTWHWGKGPTFPLSAGKHTLIIRNREDGVKLDQFLLTTDTGYRPVRFE